ncbi:MAG TPA: universal stress protein [Rhodanobacteraceae bacterium]|jgi:nucleotide-binding universal stress UspA family protein
MFKHILIPTAGDPGSKRAAEVGVELARLLGARVTFFHAMMEFAHVTGVAELLEPAPDQLLAEAQSHADKLLAPLRRMAEQGEVQCRLESAPAEEPWKAILAAARKARCDLIVMASHKRSGVARLVLGSVTQKVLNNTGLPVLVVR